MRSASLPQGVGGPVILSVLILGQTVTLGWSGQRRRQRGSHAVVGSGSARPRQTVRQDGYDYSNALLCVCNWWVYNHMGGGSTQIHNQSCGLLAVSIMQSSAALF